ncbi:hypothetical protein BGZ49_000072 [Haplosporangium sp. Z 27]|nr:hypothetical protein BGZ49_000072 [Haplosporangium sp. Z 27]
MSSTITVFCVINGMSEPFSIDINPEKTVDHLKKAIKTEKSIDFANVDADNLHLWQVSLSINDYDDDAPITLQDHTNARKLRPISKLSKVFETLPPPEDTIHMIVQKPDRTDSSLGVDVAKLRKDLSDMTRFFDGTFIFSIQFRSSKHTYPWTTNIESATVAEFRSALISIMPQHANDKYLQIYSYESSSSTAKYQIVQTDIHLRNILSISRKSRGGKLFVSLLYPSKSYSQWTFEEVCAEFDLGTSDKPTIIELPRFEGIEAAPLDTNEKIRLRDELVVEITKRQSSIKNVRSNEASRSLVVASFLVAATELFKDDLVLDVEREVNGPHGHGPVDYSVHSRKTFRTIEYTLGVTEVKHEKIAQGYAQNILQLESALYGKRKRSIEDVEDDDNEDQAERPNKQLKSYGIVTDGSHWHFLECTMHSDDSMTYRAAPVVDEDTYFATAEERIEMVFRKLIWLFSKMKEQIIYEDEIIDQASAQRKRIKSTNLDNQGSS